MIEGDCVVSYATVSDDGPGRVHTLLVIIVGAPERVAARRFRSAGPAYGDEGYTERFFFVPALEKVAGFRGLPGSVPQFISTPRPARRRYRINSF